MPHEPKRDRRFTTYRLTEEDYALLSAFNKNSDNKYDALLQLVPILQNLNIKAHQLKNCRIGMPIMLDELIKAKVKESGYTFVDVLLIAIREFNRLKTESGIIINSPDQSEENG